MESTNNTTETKAYAVTFPWEWLKAIRLFSADNKDARPYLRGVAISPRGGLVATNGHMLGVMLDDRFKDVPELIIPNATIDNFVRDVAGVLKSHEQLSWAATVRWEDAGLGVSSSKNGVLQLTGEEEVYFSFPFASIAGTYADYTRVLLPDHITPYGHPQFNYTYLVAFNQAYQTLNPEAKSKQTGAYLIPNGTAGGIRVRLLGVPQFEGVLMPLRLTNGLRDEGFEQPDACAPLDDFVGCMKQQLVQALGRNPDIRRWQCAAYNEARLNRMFHECVADGDMPGAANLLMMLHRRGEKLTSYDAGQDLRKVA